MTVRFYQELNDFLRPCDRGQSLEIGRAPPTVRALIEDLGVPHTEVDLVLVNGSPVALDHRLSDSDRVSVYPVFESLDIRGVTRVRPSPLREPRFLLDVHLGALARLLRMIGFDAEYATRALDTVLARRAADEARALLTRDRQLLKHRIVTRGYCVRSTDSGEQAVEVLCRFDLTGSVRPLSRCLRCNLPLQPLDVPPLTVPPAVRSSATAFARCAGCNRTYWRGSHWHAMMRTVARLVAASSSDRLPSPPGSELPASGGWLV